jgi:uncharacterized repeat protein (TIGR03803 family)
MKMSGKRIAGIAAIASSVSSAFAAPTLTTLVSFNNTDGASPQSSLISDAAGNLYGTTSVGGASSEGTVFEIAVGSGTFTTLVNFNNSSGGNPCAGLTADAVGNLYGTTDIGGSTSAGSVFEVAAGSHTLSTLATFNVANGQYPNSSLIADAAGDLYGTTYSGGASGDGTVFEVNAASHSISTLLTFNGSNGKYSYSNLIFDHAGNLYGTTYSGGTGGYGTAFEITAGTHTLITLASFNSINGKNPFAGLIADAAGNLYGATIEGGASNYGTVFEIAAGSQTFSTLATFNNANGGEPYGNLIADANGNLYGTTMVGGTSSDGTVFEIAAGSHALTTLATFSGTNGRYPWASLFADAGGNLYGTTSGGGASGAGTVFELTGTSFAVPEPSGLSVLALAAVCIFRRSRWR